MISCKYSKVLLTGLVCPLLLLLLFLNRPLFPLWHRCACECEETRAEVTPRQSDIDWVLQQVQVLRGSMKDGAWLVPRKGINPRTRQQQLLDLRRFHGISHYENGSRSPLSCPQELLVEPHHSYYGEPWAGGRDVFEFLAASTALLPRHRVLEVGCGTLRVAAHFIRFLRPSHFHCLERDALSLAAALLYELPANGLLRKRPSLMLDETLPPGPPFDLVYASAVFLHMPDEVVWRSLDALSGRLADPHGRLFVSHNIKFCTRLRSGCEARLRKAGLQLVGRRTHDSLLFNHFEVWFEFKQVPRIKEFTSDKVITCQTKINVISYVGFPSPWTWSCNCVDSTDSRNPSSNQFEV